MNTTSWQLERLSVGSCGYEASTDECDTLPCGMNLLVRIAIATYPALWAEARVASIRPAESENTKAVD